MLESGGQSELQQDEVGLTDTPGYPKDRLVFVPDAAIEIGPDTLIYGQNVSYLDGGPALYRFINRAVERALPQAH